jgi:hypothetical protein
MAWAYLGPEPKEAAADSDVLVVSDHGPVTVADRLINTRGSSLNYTVWDPQALAPFCADRSSLKGED